MSRENYFVSRECFQHLFFSSFSFLPSPPLLSFFVSFFFFSFGFFSLRTVTTIFFCKGNRDYAKRENVKKIELGELGFWFILCSPDLWLCLRQRGGGGINVFCVIIIKMEKYKNIGMFAIKKWISWDCS